MKVYVATSGSYSDYHIRQVFKNKADAEAYAARVSEGEVAEFEVLEEVPERRVCWNLWWDADWEEGKYPYNDKGMDTWSREEDYAPAMKLQHQWSTNGYGHKILSVQGWSKEDVLKVYSEQRAMYLARHEGIA